MSILMKSTIRTSTIVRIADVPVHCLMMTLPNLPTIRKKTEAHITPRVLQWFREHSISSCAIEIKQTSATSIPSSALKDHQRAALHTVAHGTLVHKIADARRRNPFDAFLLSHTNAFVVACFIKHKKCLVIPIDEWQGATPSTPASYVIDL